MLRGLGRVLFAVVLAGLALYGSWRWLRSESIPGNSNMVVTCEPACKAGTDFVLSVSNTGSTNLPAGAPGIARLGVLLPEPTTLEERELTSDGNPPIPSGLGVPHYGSGNLFSHIDYPTNDSLDFSTFQALSATAGVKVSSYNARAFSLGSFNTPGALITPVKSSKFSGASGFPPGTIFFAFLSNGNDNMRVVNHTPSNALVVVRAAN